MANQENVVTLTASQKKVAAHMGEELGAVRGAVRRSLLASAQGGVDAGVGTGKGVNEPLATALAKEALKCAGYDPIPANRLSETKAAACCGEAVERYYNWVDAYAAKRGVSSLFKADGVVKKCITAQRKADWVALKKVAVLAMAATAADKAVPASAKTDEEKLAAAVVKFDAAVKACRACGLDMDVVVGEFGRVRPKA